MSLLLEVMAVLKCPPNSMLVRDCCDFEMCDETRLADVSQVTAHESKHRF